jgi:RNA polymerase sigma factor (TIGR02999 family)
VTAPSPAPGPPNVTELLLAWADGDRSAFEALLPAVYDELHRQAARAIRREAPGHTLHATDLVHEAYLRLVDEPRVRWEGRAQFFGIAARTMRRVLVDHARARHAAKRGGGAQQITLRDDAAAAGAGAAGGVDVLALDEALSRLGALDARQARVVELRYFAGLGIEEAAEVLGVSPATVKRDWALARAWLRRELEPG